MIYSVPESVDVPVLEEGVDGGVHGDELQVHVPCTLPTRDLSNTRESLVKKGVGSPKFVWAPRQQLHTANKSRHLPPPPATAFSPLNHSHTDLYFLLNATRTKILAGLFINKNLHNFA